MQEKEYILKSENILYVPISSKYIDDYLTMVNDLDISKLISNEVRTYSYDDEKNWVDAKLKEQAIIFTMLDIKDKRFIGNIELNNFNGISAELGISITKNEQNKHYGSEGIRTILDYGFNTLNLEEITLKVFSINERAIHCYKKLGFIEYRVDKNAFIIDNQNVDEIHMRLSRKKL